MSRWGKKRRVAVVVVIVGHLSIALFTRGDSRAHYTHSALVDLVLASVHSRVMNLPLLDFSTALLTPLKDNSPAAALMRFLKAVTVYVRKRSLHFYREFYLAKLKYLNSRIPAHVPPNFYVVFSLISLHVMQRTVFTPDSEFLSIEPEDDPRQTPERCQAHVGHDWRHISARLNPSVDKLREPVTP